MCVCVYVWVCVCVRVPVYANAGACDIVAGWKGGYRASEGLLFATLTIYRRCIMASGCSWHLLYPVITHFGPSRQLSPA